VKKGALKRLRGSLKDAMEDRAAKKQKNLRPAGGGRSLGRKGGRGYATKIDQTQAVRRRLKTKKER